MKTMHHDSVTREDMIRWFREGQELGATDMILVCDGFSFDDYPVYVMPGEDFWKKKVELSKNMQRVIESFSLSGDPETDI